jgi:Arc/MetJ-type ribon-helix-helix transcriptional regulator
MTVKIAVSLPEQAVEAARAAVREGKAASVSAYVAEAMLRRGQQESLASVLADFDAEFGAPDAESGAWADDVLGIGQSK